jgi:hypothetical protein
MGAGAKAGGCSHTDFSARQRLGGSLQPWRWQPLPPSPTTTPTCRGPATTCSSGSLTTSTAWTSNWRWGGASNWWCQQLGWVPGAAGQQRRAGPAASAPARGPCSPATRAAAPLHPLPPPHPPARFLARPQALPGREPVLQLNYGGGRSRGGGALNQHKGRDGAPAAARHRSGAARRSAVPCCGHRLRASPLLLAASSAPFDPSTAGVRLLVKPGFDPTAYHGRIIECSYNREVRGRRLVGRPLGGAWDA